MARITQNRRKALFSLWSFNQSEAGKKTKKTTTTKQQQQQKKNKMLKYLFNERKNILYDSQNSIKSTNVS